MKKLLLPLWQQSNGKLLSCNEKIKVMQQNIDELHQMLQDAYTDALIMNVDEKQFKQFLINLIQSLDNPYDI